MSGLGARLIQSPELRQEMKINPRLYQAMELLHLPLLDLQQRLKQEMTENPFLEVVEGDTEQEVELDQDGVDEDGDEVDWESILLDGFDAGGRRAQYEARDFDFPTPSKAPDLRDHLENQTQLLTLSGREQRIAQEIIGNIDDDGLLRCPLETITDDLNGWLEDVRDLALEAAEDESPEELAAMLAPFDVGEVEAMLEIVQDMDPPGVGARDLRECLLIQLRESREENELIGVMVDEHFDDLLSHRWANIARALGVAPRLVQDAADRLARLDPKPGLRYSPEPEHYIVPDLIVEKISGEYMVFANDTSMPQLRLARSYQEVARDKRLFQGENKTFIKDKLNSASWMIQAIEQRRQTMLKVMQYIVERQRGFFENGVQHLRPLTLREVADHIEMHESTVSRVTNEKFVQTPRGVFSLKYFFSSGLSTTSGTDISARGVKAKMEALISGEDVRKPLTDMALVKLLRADGVRIARRTVAKYRDQLGILPARMRKRL
ncbi:MAG: RNA polymerase factor sigma-54 [Gammaproteobacteria bacterium]|nr:RNA polymerase factor sigma-54 [Gammaproteobacteria bacterium]MDE0257459.1 RNA polymerase factor sigma-54 [Gammaproteobacteria bacterium]